MLDAMLFPPDDVPERDQFTFWRDQMAPYMLLERRGAAAEFQLRQRFLRLGPVLAWAITSESVSFHRTPTQIKRADPGALCLTGMLQGAGAFLEGGREAAMSPDSLHATVTSRPSEGRMGRERGRSTCWGLMVPDAVLPLPRRTAERALGMPMSAREGVGALLTGVLTRLATETDTFQVSDGPYLGSVLTDLMAALFAGATGDERSLSPETRERTLTLRIRSFIQQHLQDPDLTPRTIAAANHISVSYLHRLFQECGLTVSSWTRHQRLEKARTDLGDPAQQSLPVYQIASRWGFTQPSVFSRVFRTVYGVSPTDYRHRACVTRRAAGVGTLPGVAGAGVESGDAARRCGC